MNVGLFGGTFNPIHQGHIRVITHVKSVFSLNTVHIIPSAVPPHKTTEILASAEDRFEMVKNAIAGIHGFMASDIEITRKGKSFSIDTIRHFRNIIDSNTTLYFIMGSDAFFDMNTWKNSVDIFRLTDIIVMRRAGDTRKPKDIRLFLKDVISSGYKLCLQGNTVRHDDSDYGFKTVHICNVPEVPISSTLVREKIGKQESISELVPHSVESVIIGKQLYL